MSGDVVASIIAREHSRSRMTEPSLVRVPRRRHRAAARVLHAWAQRLDPQVAAPRHAVTG
jgi:hypothetical protein